MNRPSSESHQTCLNGRVVREEEQSSTDHLREFDRIRTCVDKCHKLAPKPLGHKLHKKLLQMDSNHHLQNRNLVCYHYTMEQFVMREGLEPTTRCFVDNCSNPTELPHHLRKQKDSRSTLGRFACKEPPEPDGSTR